METNTSEKQANQHDSGPVGHVHGPDCSHSHHQEPYVRTMAKVGRNDPCPCGSAEKYKKCHGKKA